MICDLAGRQDRNFPQGPAVQAQITPVAIGKEPAGETIVSVCIKGVRQ
jgi:hypothetical protein